MTGSRSVARDDNQHSPPTPCSLSLSRNARAKAPLDAAVRMGLLQPTQPQRCLPGPPRLSIERRPGCEQSANMPHTTQRQKGSAPCSENGFTGPRNGRCDVLRHEGGGLVNRGSAVRVRSPALSETPANAGGFWVSWCRGDVRIGEHALGATGPKSLEHVRGHRHRGLTNGIRESGERRGSACACAA
jgi:hypothetical protein